MNRKAETLIRALQWIPGGRTVVEVGCIRRPGELASDGYSTRYLAEQASRCGWRLHSIDVDAEAIGHAQAACEGFDVTFHHGDGAEVLAALGTVTGLYLDGSAEPSDALDQYRAAKLAKRCTIVVDDVQAFNGNRRGKGDLVLDVLEEDGFTVSVHRTEPGYLMAVANR